MFVYLQLHQNRNKIETASTIVHMVHINEYTCSARGPGVEVCRAFELANSCDKGRCSLVWRSFCALQSIRNCSSRTVSSCDSREFSNDTRRRCILWPDETEWSRNCLLVAKLFSHCPQGILCNEWSTNTWAPISDGSRPQLHKGHSDVVCSFSVPLQAKSSPKHDSQFRRREKIGQN